MSQTTTTTVFAFGGGNQAEIGTGSASGGISALYAARVGFYGTTPATQQASTLGTAVATTVAVSTTTGTITSWGFSTSTQANNLTVQVADIYNALTTLGLLST